MGDSVQSRIIKKLLQKFPNAASRTLARIAYKENPLLWKKPESARSLIRAYRGAMGNKLRTAMKNREHYRSPRKSGDDPFGKIPEGKTHFENWEAYQLHGPLTALVLPDVHIPYHDPFAVKFALRTGKERNVTHVILNGDTMDFFSISAWETDPVKRDLADELSTGRAFLRVLREIFPKALFIFKVGNHEERWERYLWVKAPELCGVDDIKLEAILHLDSNTVVVRDKRPIRCGKLSVIHGHEFGGGRIEPINPARGFFLRAKDLCLGSHFHRASMHPGKDINGKIIRCWSTGCLCNLNPDYRPINEWYHGFAIIEVDKNDAFRVDNYSIIDGQLY